MTSPTGPGPLSVGSPAAVLAIVPHLLGFVPDKSLVIVGAGQPRGRIHVTSASTCLIRPTRTLRPRSPRRR